MCHPSKVPDLRKSNADGVAYYRPPEIQSLLELAYTWTSEELVRRATISQRQDSEYVPSELVVHQLRATRGLNDDELFSKLYPLLEQRFLASFPTSKRFREREELEDIDFDNLRTNAWNRFVEQLLVDREGYEEQLDYFEVRFDHAVQQRRRDAFKNYYRKDKTTEQIEYGSSGELDPAVEQALTERLSAALNQEETLDFRFNVRRAIDLLPENERRVIDMELLGYPDESKDPDMLTISGTLDCTPRTVRNRRKSALQHIRETLNLELNNGQ